MDEPGKKGVIFIDMVTMLWRNKKFHIERHIIGLKHQMEMLRLDRVGKGVTEVPTDWDHQNSHNLETVKRESLCDYLCVFT